MSLAGCQIKPIDVNSHLQKSLKVFDKKSADQIWSKKDRGWKVPCLMPIRVKLSSEMNDKLKLQAENRKYYPTRLYLVYEILGFLYFIKIIYLVLCFVWE